MSACYVFPFGSLIYVIFQPYQLLLGFSLSKRISDGAPWLHGLNCKTNKVSIPLANLNYKVF